MAGNSVISRAVPGADHAVMTGTLSAQLRRIPDPPAPMEMPHIQEAIMSPDTWATSAAWKKITAGPEYEISTARNPAAMAEIDQSPLSGGFPGISVFWVPVAGFCMTILWHDQVCASLARECLA